MTGTIIVITGTSGAGKTTASQAFARRSKDPYVLFGMDLLVGAMFPAKYTMFGEKKMEGFYGNGLGPMGWTAMHAMHEMVAAAARAGQNMVVDHHLFMDPPILQDFIWSMKDIPVLLVTLKVPYDVLEQRLLGRQIEPPASLIEAGGADVAREMAESLRDLIPWFYKADYENDCNDLEIDSSIFSPDEICELIEARLAQGPGTAFETLRLRHARPFP